MNAELIEHYANGGQLLSMSIRGLTADDMKLAPGPGAWTTQQVVVHLADAEAAFADRMRRMIATDNAVLLAWDHNAFAAKLHYDEQSVEDAVALIDLTRRQMARVLRQLPEAAFGRVGQHSERGPQSLVQVVTSANNHLTHHLKFIADKREKLGKLMW